MQLFMHKNFPKRISKVSVIIIVVVIIFWVHHSHVKFLRGGCYSSVYIKAIYVENKSHVSSHDMAILDRNGSLTRPCVCLVREMTKILVHVVFIFVGVICCTFY